MLTIRNEQLEAFAAAKRVTFESQMVEYLESAYPDRFSHGSGGQPGPAREFVQNGMKKASNFQITVERDVSDFIRLMVFFGPDFEDSKAMSWTKRLLEDPDIPGQGKIRMILQDLTEGEHTDLLPEEWNRGN